MGSAGDGAGRLGSMVARVGDRLARTLREVIRAIPGGEPKPTAMAKRLGMSRVILSRLLGAVTREDSFEVLQRVPGPESLRRLTTEARKLGVSEGLVRSAEEAIDDFGRLIREEFGTRGALHAAVSPRKPELERRFGVASRYQVFKGMRAIMGVEAETWLNCMIFTPTAGDEESVTVTSIDGPLGLRRLRPDIAVHITCGSPTGKDLSVTTGPVTLEEFYENRAARVETKKEGSKLVHRLVDDQLGRRSAVDMLGLAYTPGGSRRYSAPDRPQRGSAWFPDIPVKRAVFDVLVHDSLYPGSEAKFVVYNPGSRGLANPSDRSRDIDRVPIPEGVEALHKREGRFTIAETPKYEQMLMKVLGAIGVDPRELRLFRVRMAYPVYGFQYVMMFDAPPPPAGR